MKICSRCKNYKELTEFSKHRGHNDGLNSWCKKCRSEFRKKPENRNKDRILGILWRKKNPEKAKEQSRKARERHPDKSRKFFLKDLYGMTIEQYNLLFEKQQGKCAICERHQSELTKRLHVDHNHNTGKTRGLLCHYCNTALGSFKEDITLLNKAIEYLKNHNA
jgi:Recombination endonuclease VII